MSDDRQKLKAEILGCLGQDKPAGELVDCIGKNFPDAEAYRENDDLIVKSGTRFLIVRRTGRDSFRVSENIVAPSTNLVDFGGGTERNLDQLIDEISSLGA